MKRIVPVGLALLLLPGLAGAAEAGTTPGSSPPTAHVILPFRNASARADYAPLGGAIADLLALYLAADPSTCVVDREQLGLVLREHKSSLTGEVNADSRLIARHITGAKVMHTGSFSVEGSELTIHVRSVDVETSKVLRTDRAKGLLREIHKPCLTLAKAIVTGLGGAKGEFRTDAIDDWPEANTRVARGLGLFWAGDCAAAASEFLLALQQAPDHSSAHFWLGRAFFANGAYADAALEFRWFRARRPDHDLAPQAETFIRDCEGRLSAADKRLVDRLAARPEKSFPSELDVGSGCRIPLAYPIFRHCQ